MNRGGLETMLMNYYRQMDREKIQYDFMVHRSEDGHYDKEILELGGRIYRFPPIKPGNYRVYFRLLDEFFKEHTEYKVIHSHINENSSFVLRSANKVGIPCRIAHSHTSNLGIDYKLPFRIYARMTMKKNANKYFACSKNAGEWLFSKKQEVTIIKNAINLEEFQFNEIIRDNVRSKMGIKDKLIFGHVGRFNKSKNHDFLIDVFKEIYKLQPNSILVLIGEGDRRSIIEKKVEKLGLTTAVKFLGLRNDIPLLLQAMDLFIFPSYFEGAPVSLIEAQAAGLKCVVSDTISEDINLTGLVEFFSLRESPEKWAKEILKLPFERKDTTGQLLKSGYDIVTMANHLAEYYINNTLEKIN
ncbi:glycosyltransferase family 1 protein [Neobacillus drentensis]|uniref:glycosyltransferase family 1 protein n=1 Tax=Neobacillus drentensis TaxID=220684 RepID=UPI002FFEF568